MKTNPALSALRHHVSGAIARGEAQAITEIPAPTRPAYTPGPWRFMADGPMDENCDILRVEVPADFRGSGYANNPSIESLDGREIVGCDEYLVFGPTNPEEERAANVRLICAAPDLLYALEIVMSTARFDSKKSLAAAIKARAAIAKARG